MKQMTLASAQEFEKHNRATRKAEFLARMGCLMPWAEFCAVIEPHYPKAENGRSPTPAKTTEGSTKPFSTTSPCFSSSAAST